MKKVFDLKKVVAIFVVSTMFACTQDINNEFAQVENEQEESITMKALPKRRTYAEALTIAQDAIGMLGESSTTRSGKPRAINTDDVQYIVNTSSTRSTDEPDTLMYVFNYEDNAGFAVVSANRATEELIVVAEQGSYTVGEETDNIGFGMYMDMAQNYIESAHFDSLIPQNDPGTLIEFQWITSKTVLTNYGPFVKVKWGQGYPYNIFCFEMNGEQALAGCVATAIAQILSYYKHPTSIQITYDSPIYTQSLNWTEICRHRETSTCLSCSSHSTQIGKLFRQIGEEVNMNYGVSVSLAFTDSACFAFDVLGYNHGTYQSYNTSIAINSLSQNQIVLMRGKEGNSGHAWVLDGYQYVRIDKTEYTRPVGEELWTKGETRTSYASYNHLNWGWNGDSNGYYLTNVFDTQAASDLDFGVSNDYNYNFNIGLKMIPNICPTNN